MAFKSEKVSYVIYPPNYKPGDGFKEAKTMNRALGIANNFGSGSEIHKNVCRLYKDGSCLYHTVKIYDIVRK